VALQVGPTPTTGQSVTRVDNGSDGGSVVVVCDVKASGGGFSIELEAGELSLSTGGDLRVSGEVTDGGTGTNIAVAFNAGGQNYTASDCTVTTAFAVTPGVPPAPPSVAAGRIFGHLECPDATSQTAIGSCALGADFVFENCSE
jgi:hypothetical protein